MASISDRIQAASTSAGDLVEKFKSVSDQADVAATRVDILLNKLEQMNASNAFQIEIQANDSGLNNVEEKIKDISEDINVTVHVTPQIDEGSIQDAADEISDKINAAASENDGERVWPEYRDFDKLSYKNKFLQIIKGYEDEIKIAINTDDFAKAQAEFDKLLERQKRAAYTLDFSTPSWANAGSQWEETKVELGALNEKIPEIKQLMDDKWGDGGMSESFQEAGAQAEVAKSKITEIQAVSNQAGSGVDNINKKQLTATQTGGTLFRLIYNIQRMANGSLDGFADALSGSSSAISGIADGTIETSGAMSGVVEGAVGVFNMVSQIAPAVFLIQTAWKAVGWITEQQTQKAQEYKNSVKEVSSFVQDVYSDLESLNSRLQSSAQSNLYFKAHTGTDMSEFFNNVNFNGAVDNARAAARTFNRELKLAGKDLEIFTSRADVLATWNATTADSIASTVSSAFLNGTEDAAKEIAQILGLDQAAEEQLVNAAKKGGTAWQNALNNAFNNIDYTKLKDDLDKNVVGAFTDLENAINNMWSGLEENPQVISLIESLTSLLTSQDFGSMVGGISSALESESDS